MFFKQLMMDDSGALSYVVGCPVARTACVVNPKKNIHEYIETAITHNFQITAIFETSGYLDHKSGHEKLTSLTGAPVYFLEKKERIGHELAEKGDIFTFGMAEISIVDNPQYATNGNAILLRDHGNPNKPWLVLNRRCLYADNLSAATLAGKSLSARLMDYMDSCETGADSGLTDNIASLTRNIFHTSRTQLAKLSLPV